MKPTRSLLSFLFGSVFLTTQLAQAATFYWDSNGNLVTATPATGTWGTDDFWSTDSTGATATGPQTIDNTSDLFFSAAANSTGGTVTVNGTQSAHSITFDDATGGITLSGGTAINLGSATAGSGLFFTNATGSANVISTGIILNSAATDIAISNSGTAPQTIGDITGSAAGLQTVTVGATSSGGITLGGIISNGGGGGTVGLTVNSSGAGITTLTAANLYTGTTTINRGTLQVGNGTTGSLNGTTGTALTFGGTGTINFNEAAGSTQGMGLLTLTAGQATVQSTWAGSGTNSLTFSNVTARSAGASVNFVQSGGTNGSDNSIILTQYGGANTVAGALIDRGVFFNGDSYATANAASGYLRAYTSSDTNASTAAAGANTITVASSNVFVTGAITGQAAIAVNTLNLGNNTLALSGALQTNGILASGGVAAAISGSTIASATGSAEMVIRVNAASDVLTISSQIVNNGTTPLTKSGDGTLILTAANTYTGTTRIGSGTLQLGNGGATGALSTSSSIVIAGGGNLTINRSDAITQGTNTFANNITGAGSVTMSGSNNLTLGTNTHTGGFILNSGAVVGINGAYAGFGTGTVTINGGTLQITSSANATIANNMLWNAATMNVNRASSQDGTINWNGNITLGANVSFTIAATMSHTMVFNGNIVEDITGNRSLTITGGNGSRPYTFNGTNTYTGNTSTNGSTVTIGGSGSFGSGGTYAGAFNTNAKPLLYSSSANQMFSGIISVSTLTKDTSATSTLTLSGASANVISGLTSVTAGTLVLNKSGAANAIVAGGLTIGGNNNTAAMVQYSSTAGTDQIGASTINILGRGILDINGKTDTVGGTWTINTTGATGTNPTPIINTAGGGSLTIGSTLGITPASGLTTIIDLNGAALGLSGATATISTGGSSGNVQITNATWAMPNATRTFTVGLGSGSTYDLDLGLTMTTGGAAGGLIFNSTGRVQLSGSSSNTFTAVATTATSVSGGGTLLLNKSGTANAIPVSGLIVTGSTVKYTATAGSDQINNAAPVTLANGAGVATLDLNGISDTIGTLTIGGASGTTTSQGVVTTGLGTLTLAGNVTYTSTGNSTVTSSISGKLDLGAATRTFTIGDSTATAIELDVSADISGTGVGLIKSGAGTMRLSGTNTYDGTTTVSAGVLNTTKAAALAGYNSAGKVVFNGGTLGVQVGGSGWTTGQVDTLLANAIKTSGAFAIDTSTGDVTQWTAFTNNNLSSTIGLTKLGTGTLVMDQANTYSGTTNIAAGTLQLAHASALGGGNAINFTGGTLQFTSSNTADYASRIMLSASPIALDTNGQSVTLAGNINLGNTGGLTKSGTGTLTLSGANGFSGTTTVSAGTLTLTNALALQNSALDTTSAGAVTLSGLTTLTLGGLSGATGNLASVISSGFTGNVTDLTLNPTSGSVTYGGAIANTTMSLTKTGAGTQILSGSNTYTGLTTVRAGTLQIGNSSTGSLNGTTGTDLTFAATGTFNVQEAAGVSQGMGALTFSGGDGTVTSTWNNGAGSGNTALTFDSLTARAAGATGNFTLAGTGSTATNNRIALTSATNAPLTTGSNNQGIFFGGSNYARYNATTNTFAAVAYGTDSNATTVATGATIGATTSASDINITGAITAQTTAAVNTIKTGTAITQTGGSTLNVNGILTTATVAIGTAGNNLQTTGAGGDMVFNTTSGTTTVAANIINNSGSTLTKSGTGGLTLTGTNTYAGGTFLNGGTLTTATNASLGAASSGITVNGDVSWSVANVAYARSITINAGATLTMSGGSGADVTGALTGNGTYKVPSAVGYDFTNLNNTFTGVVDTSGWGNTWASLGDSSNPIIPGNSGGFGWTGVAKTFALRPFTLGGNGTILSSGSGALVIQQPLAITGAAGARTLTLSGTYTGSGNQFAGNIADGPGSVVSLTRGNAGTTWALSGTNTYSGATTNTWTGTGTVLTFQGMQALSPNTSLNSTSTLGGGANAMGTFRFLDDSTTPSSRSTVNVNINAGENADPAPTSNQNQMYLFVGNNSTANGGNGSGTTSGSTIQLGNVNFTQSNAGNVKGAYLTLTGANGYKLQVADVNITRQAAHTGNWNAMLRADAPMTVTGTVRQATGGGVGSTSTLQLEGSAAGSLISGNVLNSADSTPRVMLLSKAGIGDWTLSGSNSYTGGTTITTGKLLFSGANSLPATGTVAVGAAGHLSLADGTARNQTVSALTLTSLGSLSFDWTGNNAGDQLTSTADITPTAASRFAINLNRSGTPGGSVTLLTGGAGSTLSSSSFYLANLTNYTAALTVTPTSVSVGSYAAQTALTTIYWQGDKLAAGVAGVRNAWALSDGTVSNWSSTTTAYTATALTPGATANVIFANGQVGKTQQSTVLGSDVSVNSVVIDDSVAVTIAGANGAGLTLMSSLSTAGTVSGTPGSAITVTSNANVTSTISSNVILGADQTWNVANGKTLTVSGVISGGFSLTKADAGTVNISVAPTYTGTTTINAGTLQIGNSAAANTGGVLFGGSPITLQQGATLFFSPTNQHSIASGGLTVGSNITLAGGVGTATIKLALKNDHKYQFLGSVTGQAGVAQTLAITNDGAGTGGSREDILFSGNIADGAGGGSLGLSVAMKSQVATDATFSNFSGQNTFTGPISVTTTTSTAGGYLVIGGERNGNGLFVGSGYLGGGNYTNTISVGSNSILDYASTASQILGGAISGAGSLRMDGTGALILSGPNNYTGSTTAATGSLVARSGTALGSGGTANVSVSAGAALSYVAATDTALSIGGTLAINGGTGTTIGGSIGATTTSSQINVAGNATSTAAAVKVNIYGNSFSAATDGTGTYTLVQGGGTNTLNNAVLSLGTVYNNTNFTVGALASTANNITVGITTATPLTGNTYYVGGLTGATNVWAASNGSTRSNFATSSGGVAQALVPGSGADVIVDTNSNATSTVLGSDMAINSLTISDTSKGLGLNADGYKLTIGTGGISMSASVPTSTIAANVGLGGNQIWTNNSTNSLTVSGVISGSGTLDKNGSGTLRVSGTNTYSGATTVNQGTLLVNNTAGSGTGTAAVSVAAGATLGGTGMIAGAVNVTGQLSPGASIETLGTGALALLNGSMLVHELDSSVGTSVGSDLLKVTGNLDLGATVGLSLDDLAATDVAFVDNDVFSLINYTGTWNNGMFTFSGNELSDEEVFAFGLNTWKISYDDAAGGLNYSGEFAGGADSFVNLTVVSTIPEPGAVFLGSMGLLLILRRRR